MSGWLVGFWNSSAFQPQRPDGFPNLNLGNNKHTQTQTHTHRYTQTHTDTHTLTHTLTHADIFACLSHSRDGGYCLNALHSRTVSKCIWMSFSSGNWLGLFWCCRWNVRPTGSGNTGGTRLVLGPAGNHPDPPFRQRHGLQQGKITFNAQHESNQS